MHVSALESRQAARLLDRVRKEYRDSPGLNLTDAQMRRLLDVDAATCRELVETLVDADVLERSPSGQIVAKRRT
jgi:DNA-binding IclR family transcriptional regulator